MTWVCTDAELRKHREQSRLETGVVCALNDARSQSADSEDETSRGVSPCEGSQGTWKEAGQPVFGRDSTGLLSRRDHA